MYMLMPLLCTMLSIVSMTVSRSGKVGKYLANAIQPFKMSVTNKKSTPSFTYHINAVPIKAVQLQHAKYLGVARLKTNMEGAYKDNHI